MSNKYKPVGMLTIYNKFNLFPPKNGKLPVKLQAESVSSAAQSRLYGPEDRASVR